jgi:uncharacterized protein (DUF1499 family)
MSRLWLLPSGLVVLLVVLGPILASLGWVDGFIGFRLYFLGSILAALSAMGLGAAAALGSALGKSWRRPAVQGAVIPLLVTLVALIALRGRATWPFHEVSTDLENPPPFIMGPAVGESFPEEVGAAQRQMFPDLESIRLDVPPVEGFPQVVATARGMPSWEIVRVDPPRGIVQAVVETRIFRFRDDIVIRVVPDGEGTRVDLRSRSRVGQSDLGSNAEWIRSFREALGVSPSP